MKMLAVRCLVALTLLAAATVAFANPFKSKIISGNDSVLEITVPGDHFMKITNFTQDGGTDRAVVEVTLPGDTENGGTTNVLTATRIDFSTGSNAVNFPEIGNRVTIAGPARVRIRPIVGAKLFITYKKERDEGSGGVEVEAVAQRRFRSSVPLLLLRLHRPAFQVLFFHTVPLPLISSRAADLASNGVNRLPFFRR